MKSPYNFEDEINLSEDEIKIARQDSRVTNHESVLRNTIIRSVEDNDYLLCQNAYDTYLALMDQSTLILTSKIEPLKNEISNALKTNNFGIITELSNTLQKLDSEKKRIQQNFALPSQVEEFLQNPINNDLILEIPKSYLSDKELELAKIEACVTDHISVLRNAMAYAIKINDILLFENAEKKYLILKNEHILSIESKIEDIKNKFLNALEINDFSAIKDYTDQILLLNIEKKKAEQDFSLQKPLIIEDINVEQNEQSNYINTSENTQDSEEFITLYELLEEKIGSEILSKFTNQINELNIKDFIDLITNLENKIELYSKHNIEIDYEKIIEVLFNEISFEKEFIEYIAFLNENKFNTTFEIGSEKHKTYFKLNLYKNWCYIKEQNLNVGSKVYYKKDEVPLTITYIDSKCILHLDNNQTAYPQQVRPYSEQDKESKEIEETVIFPLISISPLKSELETTQLPTSIFNLPTFPTISLMQKNGELPAIVINNLNHLAKIIPNLSFVELTTEELEHITEFVDEKSKLGRDEVVILLHDWVYKLYMASNSYASFSPNVVDAITRIIDADRKSTNYTPNTESLELIGRAILQTCKSIYSKNLEIIPDQIIHNLDINYILQTPFEIEDTDRYCLSILTLAEIQQTIFTKRQIEITNIIIAQLPELLTFHTELSLKLKKIGKQLSHFSGGDKTYSKDIVYAFDFLKSNFGYAINTNILTSKQVKHVIPAFRKYIDLIQDLIDLNPEFAQIINTPLERIPGDAANARIELALRFCDRSKGRVASSIATNTTGFMAYQILNNILATIDPKINIKNKERSVSQINNPLTVREGITKYLIEFTPEERIDIKEKCIKQVLGNKGQTSLVNDIFEVLDQYLLNDINGDKQICS